MFRKLPGCWRRATLPLLACRWTGARESLRFSALPVRRRNSSRRNKFRGPTSLSLTASEKRFPAEWFLFAVIVTASSGARGFQVLILRRNEEHDRCIGEIPKPKAWAMSSDRPGLASVLPCEKQQPRPPTQQAPSVAQLPRLAATVARTRPAA